ncbi:hypothetical protein SDC9_131071 [bioreactor metagenome]|uniref:Uncharacterized protein n=1 Tax=bioreactor metagenome TaxID=1076179 RepID=A0A645D470_9ZZZZ
MSQQKGGHIGLRPRGDDGHRVGALPQRFCHQLHRAHGGQGAVRLGEAGTVQSRLTVDIPGGDGIGEERPGTAHGDGGMDVQQSAHAPCVIGGFLDGLISGHGGDGQNVQRGAGLCQHPRHGVVVTGVSVQNDRTSERICHMRFPFRMVLRRITSPQRLEARRQSAAVWRGCGPPGQRPPDPESSQDREWGRPGWSPRPGTRP